MPKQEKYCLVLGGGGAKGVYHVGVWKALKELGIEVEAFVGSSIGAVVAGFLVQGQDEELEEIVGRIGLDFIVNVPIGVAADAKSKAGWRRLRFLRNLGKDILVHHGLDTTPLRDLLHEYLDEERIRSSGNDLGVATFNLSEFRPEELFQDEMAPGTLIDYLLASAAFPVFERTKIRGKKYVDGGIYDNVPYQMARSRGYRRIIVVDIPSPGVTRRPHIQGGVTVYIKNSIRMGGIRLRSGVSR